MCIRDRCALRRRRRPSVFAERRGMRLGTLRRPRTPRGAGGPPAARPSRPTYSCAGLDQLDVGLLAAVAGARPEFDDARVAAVAVGVTWSHVVEQLVHDLLVAQQGDGLPARVQIAALADRDGLLDERAHLFGARHACLDLLVLEQLAGETREQRLALVGRHVEPVSYKHLRAHETV